MHLYNLPEILEAAARILQAIAWPITVIVIVCWFRVPIARLILRLKQLKLSRESGTHLDFGHSPSKQIPPTGVDTKTPALNSAVKEKFGNIYWIAHDLLWTVAVLLNQGSREQILEGLYQSMHHLSEAGFATAPIGFRLQRLYEDAQRSLVLDWTNERRVQVARELQSMARDLGGTIAAMQNGFKSHPQS